MSIPLSRLSRCRRAAAGAVKAEPPNINMSDETAVSVDELSTPVLKEQETKFVQALETLFQVHG